MRSFSPPLAARFGRLSLLGDGRGVAGVPAARGPRALGLFKVPYLKISFFPISNTGVLELLGFPLDNALSMVYRHYMANRRRKRVCLTIDPGVWDAFDRYQKDKAPLFSKSQLVEILMRATVEADSKPLDEVMLNIAEHVRSYLEQKRKGWRVKIEEG